MKKPFEEAMAWHLARKPDALAAIVLNTGCLRGAMMKVWPLMTDAARRRFVIVLAELARKPRINTPSFHVTITERCARCGANLDWRKPMREDEVSTEPLLPDPAPQHDA